jgi:adenylylsulfate kinase-like enzyme
MKKLTSQFYKSFSSKSSFQFNRFSKMSDNLSREVLLKNGIRHGTLWLTGIPGAGKTTLANILHSKLRLLGETGFTSMLNT